MSQARAVIQLLLSRGLGPKTLGRLLDAGAHEQRTVEELVQLAASELVQTETRLKVERIQPPVEHCHMTCILLCVRRALFSHTLFIDLAISGGT